MWLCIFDSYRFPKRHERPFRRFYLPKMTLMIWFFICIFILFLWIYIHDESTVEGSSITKIPGFIVFEVLIIVLFIIYLGCLGAVIYWGLHGIESEKLKKCFRFYLIYFIICLVFLIINLIASLLQKLNGSSEVLLGIFLSINSYSFLFIYSVFPVNVSAITANKEYQQVKDNYNSDSEKNSNGSAIIEEISVDSNDNLLEKNN
ncbi:transmembrane protein [Anaeramoeba flamelloides]|uniref:Transmembrane protein n=1 Tax=Anaeramoeba flamelloides TaxID=1746091 RepID=A0ABQ8YPA4_9EUKA|nr:transmembrane protein [Anaeramoeba flamelloides]